jgi:hypothetical protein
MLESQTFILFFSSLIVLFFMSFFAYREFRDNLKALDDQEKLFESVATARRAARKTNIQ